MKIYTYSEARQRLATVLDEARREGRVQIRRRTGEVFVVQPAGASRSPLEVRGVKAKLRKGELADIMREIREGESTTRRDTPPSRRKR